MPKHRLFSWTKLEMLALINKCGLCVKIYCWGRRLIQALSEPITLIVLGRLRLKPKAV